MADVQVGGDNGAWALLQNITACELFVSNTLSGLNRQINVHNLPVPVVCVNRMRTMKSMVLAVLSDASHIDQTTPEPELRRIESLVNSCINTVTAWMELDPGFDTYVVARLLVHDDVVADLDPGTDIAVQTDFDTLAEHYERARLIYAETGVILPSFFTELEVVCRDHYLTQIQQRLDLEDMIAAALQEQWDRISGGG